MINFSIKSIIVVFLVSIFGFLSCNQDNINEDFKQNDALTKRMNILLEDIDHTKSETNGDDCNGDDFDPGDWSCWTENVSEPISVPPYCNYVMVDYTLTICEQDDTTKILVSNLVVTPSNNPLIGCHTWLQMLNMLPYIEKVEIIEEFEKQASLVLEEILVKKFMNIPTGFDRKWIEYTYTQAICYQWCEWDWGQELNNFKNQKRSWSGLTKSTCGSMCCIRKTIYDCNGEGDCDPDGPHFTTVGDCSGPYSLCEGESWCRDNCGW